jgi:hypothetical protein
MEKFCSLCGEKLEETPDVCGDVIWECPNAGQDFVGGDLHAHTNHDFFIEEGEKWG